MQPNQHPLPHPGFLSTELANSITHGVGLAFSMLGLAVLVILAARVGNAWHVVACSVYGATLVFLYLASTLYHSVRGRSAKRVCRIIDHAAIYLLIAGTYTPFCLVSLNGALGWSVFGVVWGAALLGILFKIFFTGRLRVLSGIVYLAMGWLALVIVKPLFAEISAGGIAWMLAGGVAYSVGVVFYAWKTFPHHHAVWHLFVMLGSACHFFAIMLYVLPIY